MNDKKQIEKEIREAYIFLRENNTTIPSDTLQFMLDASLEKLLGSIGYTEGKKILTDNIDRINKYGRHQFDRGSMKLSMVSFEYWTMNTKQYKDS